MVEAVVAAQDPEPSPSQSIVRGHLDVLQAAAAAEVAGEDRVVVIIGPAGAGKTSTLTAAVDDLHAHGRPAFGIAPTAKAARVLETETGGVRTPSRSCCMNMPVRAGRDRSGG